MAQDRKVFVGGVPQDLNQDDLYAIFSEYAGVKKAWLQKCRATDDNNGTNNPPQNHRGFGFVIFHDPNAIEELLGGSPSRFIVLRSGAKLEVKRALSSSKMSGVGNRADAPQDSPPFVWPVGGSHGPPMAQHQLRPVADPASRHRQGAIAPPPHARQASLSWSSQDGSVLSQLSLMPNSTPAYPNADLRGKAVGSSVQGLMPPGAKGPLTTDKGGRGVLLAADGTADASARWLGKNERSGAPLSYGVVSPVQPQPMLSQGLLCPPGQALAPIPVGTRQGGSGRGSLREAIVSFYQEHRPDKLVEQDFLDSICSYYKDREGELNDSLLRKYGAGLTVNQGAMPNERRTPRQGVPSPAMSPLMNPQPSPTVPITNDAASLANDHYVQLVAGRGQGIDPMYIRQLPDPSWLQLGLQQHGQQMTRPPMPQQAPPPQPGSMGGSATAMAWMEAMSGLGSPGPYPSAAPELAGYASGASVPSALAEMAAGAEVATAGAGSRQTSGGVGPTGEDVSLERDVQDGSLPQGDDDDFDISVQVAEAIVGC